MITKFCIVGLGNPDKKYQQTRHNIGFRIVDSFANTIEKDTIDKSVFCFRKKFNAELTKKKIGNATIILVKPQTFMNRSGFSVKSISDYFKIISNNLIVVHDDIDIPFGKIKLSKNSGSAGHNGVKSIIEQLGTKNFIRLRVGIKTNKQFEKTENFVLSSFSKEEEEKLSILIDVATENLSILIKDKFKKIIDCHK